MKPRKLQNINLQNIPNLTSLRDQVARSGYFYVVRRFIVIIIGTLFAAFGYSLFQVPYDLAAGGLSGISIIINHYTGWPLGTLFFSLNIPMLWLGFQHLGRWGFVSYTLLSVIVFSVGTDFFLWFLPSIVEFPITEDMFLSAVYAGIIYGLGTGLVYRAGGTPGGSSIVGRIVQRKTGIPLSQVYIYIDGLTIVVSSLVFGWEIALHSAITLFFAGLASDFVLEGPSMVRTAMIITEHPNDMTVALMSRFNRGASSWNITGGYTGQTRSMVWCTVYRSQVIELREIVADTDPKAFLVIENAHQALGGGFLPLKRQ